MANEQSESMMRVLGGIKKRAQKMRSGNLSKRLSSMTTPEVSDEEETQVSARGQEADEAIPAEGEGGEPGEGDTGETDSEQAYPNKNPITALANSSADMGENQNIDDSKERPLTVRVDELDPEELQKLIASI